MRKLIIIGVAALFILPILACGTDTTPTSPPEPIPSRTPQPPPTARPTNTPQPPPTATPTNTPEPFVGGDCDPLTERVEMNTRLDRSVQSGRYPETCEVFCLWVPDGSRLEVGISDFDVDLDIYVDIDLSVLQYEDHGRWESNAYGTGDELVIITDPGGRYYMQVCSYEGVASPFVLHNSLTR